ncbi:hypothetical protein WJX72_003332 [[Myrmecia] bisecta]|uniref:Cytochrome P450 n=1 Tax=[Myrmecia] bisecta TaxID=41462 RepID=A0AAW1QEK4_9CHLO
MVKAAASSSLKRPVPLTLPAPYKLLPVFSYLLDFKQNPTQFFLDCLTESIKQNEEVTVLRLAFLEIILLYQPAHLQHVLQDNQSNYLKSDIDKRGVGLLIGNGLVLNDGESHREHRRLMMPCFAGDRLAAFVDDMAAIAEASCSRLLAAGRAGQPVDMLEETSLAALAIIGQCGFGVDLAAQASAVGPALKTCLEQGSDGSAASSSGRSSAGDILDLLLAARYEDGTGLSNKDLRDECMTMVLAGHETSANALAWLFYFLGKRPEVVAKLRAEVAQVVGPGPVQVEHLAHLVYTEAVLKEALRLRPPVWLTDRQLAEDDVLPGGYQLKKGEYVAIAPFAYQHDPHIWPNADQFDPDRFVDGGAAEQLPKFAWMPFGAGFRRCIGQTFAMYEMKVIVATWIRAFDVQTLSDAGLDGGVTLRPNGSLQILINPLQPVASSEQEATLVR